MRSGEVSPRELVRAAAERTETLDGPLNAVIHRRFERAVEEAGDLPEGPLTGVPVLLKDLGMPSSGDPRHDGLSVLAAAGWVEDHDAAVVSRLRRSGAVILGRTNVPEMGATVTTEPAAHGPTRNPWDLRFSAGGSSGGSAAAVAAGMVPAALASDGGGSIRIPAANCGLVGLKPSRGRVSLAPDRAQAWAGLSTPGALTRTVRDAAVLLDVLGGPEPGDPYAAPALPGPLAAEVGAEPPRLRIGLLDRPPAPGVDADPEAAAAVAAAAEVLAELGHCVEPGWPPALFEPDYQRHFVTVVAVGVTADLAAWERRIGRAISDEEIEPGTATFRRIGRGVGAAGYAGALDWLGAWTRRVASFWAAGHDLLLLPVMNGAPPPLGWLTDPDHGGQRVARLAQYTSQWNVTGQPAVSLPLGLTAGGLPVGVQLVAAPGREDLLVRVSSRLEEAAPWAGRHPPPTNP